MSQGHIRLDNGHCWLCWEVTGYQIKTSRFFSLEAPLLNNILLLTPVSCVAVHHLTEEVINECLPPPARHGTGVTSSLFSCDTTESEFYLVEENEVSGPPGVPLILSE